MASTREVRAGAVELVVVDVAGHRCGFPTAGVEQVLRACAVALLPGAPPWVEGAFDLRGRMVVVVDLRARLGLLQRPLKPSDCFVVVSLRGRPVALRVDRAEDLVTLEASRVGRGGGLFEGRPIAGAVALSDGLLVVYDLDSFLTEEQQRRVEELLATR